MLQATTQNILNAKTLLCLVEFKKAFAKVAKRSYFSKVK